MDLLSDEELEQLAARDGPESLAARTLTDLHAQRAQDKQVFAFRLGDFMVVGPMPDAETELTMLLANEATRLCRVPANEATKHMKAGQVEVA